MMSVVLFLRRCAQRFLDATTDHVQGRAWGDDEETSERVAGNVSCVSQGKSHQQIKREAGAKLKNWWLTDIEKVLVEGERLNPATKHLLPFECFHEVGQNVKAASSIGAENVAFFFFLSVCSCCLSRACLSQPSSVSFVWRVLKPTKCGSRFL
jgi:hypothetical protein